MYFSKLPKKSVQYILLHILALLVIIFLPFVIIYEYRGSGISSEEMKFLYLHTITTVFWILLFYSNTSYLIPKFLYERKYILFSIIQLLLFVLIILSHKIFFELILPTKNFVLLISLKYNFIPFLFPVLGSIAIKTVSDRLKADGVATERQSEALKSELAFLRSQINPHFIFNILNNIVALSRLKSKELEPTIMKLSSLMQYMLYESNESQVLLSHEADYLTSYIDLQKQRFGKRLKINFDVDIEDDRHTIEPMLLIPFVENAFKHGMGLVPDPEIDISLKVAGNKLLFEVKNKFIEDDDAKDKLSGIGLSNVKRRLELLYGPNQELKINKQQDWFTVSLRLNLNE
jgi:sensor histidine kinase YesM